MQFHPQLMNLLPVDNEHLESDLLEKGCRTPLVTSKGFLVDGYKRYILCQKHNIPFDVIEKDFASIDEMKRFKVKTYLSNPFLSELDRFDRLQKIKPLVLSLFKTQVEFSNWHAFFAHFLGMCRAKYFQLSFIYHHGTPKDIYLLKNGKKVKTVYRTAKSRLSADSLIVRLFKFFETSSEEEIWRRVLALAKIASKNYENNPCQ